jgi:hypothetical protein
MMQLPQNTGLPPEISYLFTAKQEYPSFLTQSICISLLQEHTTHHLQQETAHKKPESWPKHQQIFIQTNMFNLPDVLAQMGVLQSNLL